jgi:hypothetical protein
MGKLLIEWANVCLAILTGTATDPPWAAGAPASAQDFLVKLYRIYQSKPNKGIDYTNPVTIRRYMTPELGALLLKKMKADEKRGGLPDLDGDPYIDAQDWTITDLAGG